MKVAYIDGCSITAGAEHRDWRMDEDGNELSHTTWAAYVCNTINPTIKYMPRARSASSQSHIRRRSMFYLTELLKDYKPKDILFLCQWTEGIRFEFRVDNPRNTTKVTTYDDNDEKHYIGALSIDLPKVQNLGNAIIPQKYRNHWLEKNKVKTVFNEIIFEHSQNTNWLYRSYNEIYCLRNFCKLHNIKMLETAGFGDIIGYDTHIDAEGDKFLQHLIDVVDVKNTIHHADENLGLVEYSRLHKFEKGVGGHPLENAHRQWALHFMEYNNL